ncbi:lamin tail domain-containing protein [Streptomyces sp. MST-110588]|uniref:lamin tail domain-containing protein n=1 Tax=Streptomyces sp. MST-110588 TaxID=2833628 RepID=UPI001F5D57A3|nr:lamin tail domain-containing protein [Streptomyces sp. MST-110588]UNO42689.1 lamin tail domain-containing protein [Streptomyces sp. MST-110588]
MRHRIHAAAAAALAVGTMAAGLVVAAPASAAGSVHITKIYYNSPGRDDRSNRSLNGEWVEIKNSTSRSVNLKGWTLTDASRHKYTFGSYSLGAGKSVKIRTGRGTDTAGNRYQNRRAYVWDNDKDTATLKKASGARVDRCSYNNRHREWVAC